MGTKSIIAVILLLPMLVFGQRKPSDFPLQPAPDNSNFETYSQKNGVNTRATMDGLRTYFAPIHTTTIAELLPTGNTSLANRVVENTTTEKIWFVDYNGEARLIYNGSNIDITQAAANPGAAPGLGEPKVHLNTTDGSLWTWNGTIWIDSNAGLAAGAGIGIAAGTISNTSPDQTVVLNDGVGISVTGVYPNFTITNTAAGGTAIIGPYRTDADAIAGGLSIGDEYNLTLDNPYGKSFLEKKVID